MPKQAEYKDVARARRTYALLVLVAGVISAGIWLMVLR